MATLNGTYYVPVDIRWVEASRDVNSGAINAEAQAVVESGGISRKLCWVCSHSNFQYQYRVRRRYSPSKAQSADGEVWEEWGDWQGCDLSADLRSAAERMSYISNTTITTDAFDFPYNFTEFDKLEYQVRARTFNPHTFECSEWGYETLTVVYKPNASFASSEKQANGDVLLTVDTDWQRGGNRFSMKNIRLSKNGEVFSILSNAAVSASGLEPDYSVTIPAKFVKTADRIYADFFSYTSDGVNAAFAADYFDVKTKGATSTVADPVVSVSDEDSEAVITVTSSGAAYEAVFVTAAFTDALGYESLVEAEVTETDGTWTAKVEAPPYDVPVNYRVSVSNAEGWKLAEVEHVTKSDGRCTWTNDEAAVSLMFDMEPASSFSPNVETYQTTRGTNVARFGRGGSRNLTLHGSLLSSSGAWRAALEALRKPATWIYRKPDGERYKVAITSVSESESKTSTGKVIAASIYMSEVE